MRAAAVWSTIAFVCAAGSTAQQVRPTTAPAQKPIAWPGLGSNEKARARLLLRKLDTAGTGADEEAAAKAVSETIARFVELGPGAAPHAFRQLRARSLEHPDRVRTALNGVVTAKYAPLIAQLASDKTQAVRVYALEWLARRNDARWAPVFVKALEDRSEEARFLAALGLAGIGDFRDLDRVFAACAEDWRSRVEVVTAVLPAARGREAAELVLDRMPPDDLTARVTGLRLLRSLAPKEFAAILATYLDHEQSQVKKEAINALRVVVDGDPPLEDLSVFRAIELAKAWKARL